MGKKCKKCGYERQPTDTAAAIECPACGAIYAKVDAHMARQTTEKRKREETAKKQGDAAAQKERNRIKRLSVCTDCGHIGKPVLVTRGSIFIEILLWLCLLLPGLIYTIWRHSSRYKACPKCRHPSMIPVDSPKGERLVSDPAR